MTTRLRTRVIVIENALVVTGALKSIMATCARLRDRFSFTFILDSRSAVADFVRAGGFDVETVPFLELSKNLRSALLYLPYLFKNAQRVLRIIDARDASVLHVNDVYNLIGVVCKILRPRLKLVQHVRLLRSSYIGPAYLGFAALVGRFADHVICVSDAVLREYGTRRKAVVHRIYDATSTEERHPQEMARGNHGRFVYVGNYFRGKGQDLALEAFSRVAARMPHATLKFVGTGVAGELDAEYVANLHRLARSRGLETRVEFAGAVDDVELEMKQADVVVNLSRSESFSMVCLEALVYGRPLIASDSGGPSEIIDHQRTGLLVPNDDVAAAADAMFQLASNPMLAAQFAREGHRESRRRFDAEASAARLAAIYQEEAE